MIKDDFYEIVADTYNIQNKNYSIEDLKKLNHRERIEKYNSGIQFEKADDIINYFSLKQIETNISFKELEKWDYIFAILSGAIGALSSLALKEPLRKLHDSTSNGGYKKDEYPLLGRVRKWLEHPGDLNDKVPGLGHRVKWGHDVLNFKEMKECIVDKMELLKIENPDANIYLMALQATLKILSHNLLADPLSKEGLPIPGHSLFRDRLYEFSKHHNKLYQELFTVKHRDLAGAGLIIGLCKIYKTSKKISKNEYRYYEINLLANSSAILFGIVFGSLNYPCLFKIFVDSVRLNLLVNKIMKSLNDSADKGLEELKLLAINKYQLSEIEYNSIIKE